VHAFRPMILWASRRYGGVLASARTGLIFTRIQEGAQPGGLTQPQPGQSRIFHTICCHAGFRWGGGGAARQELSRGSGGHSRVAVRENGSLGCAVCVVFSPYLYRCCYCSLLFPVLLNCPYPDPPVSACFFSFSSAPWQGEGRPRGAFVAGRCQTRTLIWHPTWGGDNGRTEQRVLKQLS